jgi:hypothetical protein
MLLFPFFLSSSQQRKSRNVRQRASAGMSATVAALPAQNASPPTFTAIFASVAPRSI